MENGNEFFILCSLLRIKGEPCGRRKMTKMVRKEHDIESDKLLSNTARAKLSGPSQFRTMNGQAISSGSFKELKGHECFQAFCHLLGDITQFKQNSYKLICLNGKKRNAVEDLIDYFDELVRCSHSRSRFSYPILFLGLLFEYIKLYIRKPQKGGKLYLAIVGSSKR